MAKVVSIQLKGLVEPVVIDNVDIIEADGLDLAFHPPGNTGMSARFRSDRIVDWWVVREDRHRAKDR